MKLRPCIDCGAITAGTLCDTDRKRRENQRTRPSAHARGYNTEHRNARNELKRTLPAYCGYECGTLLTPHSDWVAAHAVDGAPQFGWVASCRSCNERNKRRTPRS